MTADAPDVVAGIVDRYSRDADMLIPMMQDIQSELGYLPQEELKGLARALSVPLSRIYGIATFYASFRLVPKGDHTISLCMGTVCFLKGAAKISDAIREEFGLVAGGTSPDGKFTFSPVNCVGACALAPVMVVDGEYHGGLTADTAVELLRGVAEKGPAEAAAEAPAGTPAGGDPGAPEPTARKPAKQTGAAKAPASAKRTKTAKTKKKGKKK